jgi:DNA-binding response OmpR family regulator
MKSCTDRVNSKLLLVDDDCSLILLLKDYLEFQNYHVTIVNNGHLALAALDKDVPGIIICDVMMPEINGYEFITSLCKWQDIGWIPVLFLSALSQSMDRIKGLNLGAVAYMNKPFEAEELLAQVKSTLSHVSRIKQNVNTIAPVTLPIQVNYGVKNTATELKILLQVAKGFDNKKMLRK